MKNEKSRIIHLIVLLFSIFLTFFKSILYSLILSSKHSLFGVCSVTSNKIGFPLGKIFSIFSFLSRSSSLNSNLGVLSFKNSSNFSSKFFSHKGLNSEKFPITISVSLIRLLTSLYNSFFCKEHLNYLLHHNYHI